MVNNSSSCAGSTIQASRMGSCVGSGLANSQLQSKTSRHTASDDDFIVSSECISLSGALEIKNNNREFVPNFSSFDSQYEGLSKKQISHLRHLMAKEREQLRAKERRERWNYIHPEEPVSTGPGKHAQRLMARRAYYRERRRLGARHAQMMRRMRVIKPESGSFSDFASKYLTILNPLGKHPDFAEIIGPWLALAYQLYRADSLVDAWIALYQYGRTAHFKTILDSELGPLETIQALIPNMSPMLVLEKMHNFLGTGQIKQESLANGLLQIRSVLSSIVVGDFAQVVCNLLMSAAQLKFFGPENRKHIGSWIGHLPKMTFMEMINYCFNQLLIMCRMADDWWAGKSISDVLGGKNSIWILLEESYKILHFKDKLTTGLPVPGYMDATQFLTEASKILNRLKKAKSVMSPVSTYRIEVSRMVLALDQAVFDASQLVNSRARDMPFGIILFGDPGVGKSKLLDFILSIHSVVVGRSFDPSHVYHRNPMVEHWDGLIPHSHKYIHYTELGSLHKDIAKRSGDPAVQECISLIDTQPYPVKIAFEGKGKVFAAPEGVIIDTNDPSLNAHVVVNNPSAIERRFIFIEPVVMPHFRVAGGKNLDVTKSLASPNVFDRWTFNVYTRVPTGPKTSNVVAHLTETNQGDDIYKLSQWLYAAFAKHYSEQQRVKSFSSNPNFYLGINCSPCCPKHCLANPSPLAFCARVCKHCGPYFNGSGNSCDPCCRRCCKNDQSVPCSHDCNTHCAYNSGGGPEKPPTNPPNDNKCKSCPNCCLKQANSRCSHECFHCVQNPECKFDETKSYRTWENEHGVKFDSRDEVKFLNMTYVDKFIEAIPDRSTEDPDFVRSSLKQVMVAAGEAAEKASAPFGQVDVGEVIGQKWTSFSSFLQGIGKSKIQPESQQFETWKKNWKDKFKSKKQLLKEEIAKVRAEPEVVHSFTFKERFVLFWQRPYHWWIMNGPAMWDITKDIPKMILHIVGHLIICLLMLLASILFVLPWGKTIAYDYATRTVRTKMHESWRSALRMAGLEEFDPLETEYWRKNQSWIILIVAALSSYGLIKYFWPSEKKKRKKQQREVRTWNYHPHDTTDEEFECFDQESLQDIEKASECSTGYKRINLKHHNLWNTKIETAKANHNGSMESLYDAIARNSRLCIVGENTTTYILGVSQNFALINTHALNSSSSKLLRVSTSGVIHTEEVYNVSSIDPRSRYDLGNDVTLVKLSDVRFKDILCHIPESLGLTQYRGYLDHKIRDVRILPGPHFLGERGLGDVLSTVATYDFPNHKKGDCGKPLILDVKGSVVAGFHCGGSGPNGFAVLFSRPDIEHAILKLSEDVLMPLASDGCIIPERGLADPHPKSPFANIYLPGVEYFGAEEWTGSFQKSRVTRSFIHDAVDEEIYDSYGYISKTTFGPPLLRRAMVDGKFVSPYNVALSAISRQRKCLDRKLLRRIVSEITERIMTALNGRELKPLDMMTACNGSDVDAYLRGISLNTSAGYGFEGKKANYFTRSPEGLRIPTPELVEIINKKIEDLSSGSPKGAVFSARLKDEPREASKIKIGKTRLFYMSDLATLIVSKMFLAPFYTLMVEMGDIFCTAVGINIYQEAHRIRARLEAFSRLIVESDFKCFDQMMPVDIGWAANSIVYNVLKRSGYNDFACVIVMALLTECLFPLVELLGDLFRVAGLQPSGRYATAEDNSLRLLVMMMYMFYTVFPNLAFFLFVLLITYGDDLIASVKEEVAKGFNNIVMQKLSRECFNLDMTTSGKALEMTEFVRPEECSFIKRTFYFNERYQRWFAPLDMESIIRSLKWYEPSKNPRYEQFYQTADSALRELAFHGSEESHHKIRLWLQQAIRDEYQLEKTFDTYDASLRKLLAISADKGGPVESNPPSVMIVPESLEGRQFGNAWQSTTVIGMLASLNELPTLYGLHIADCEDPESKNCANNTITFNTDRILMIEEMRDRLQVVSKELHEYGDLSELSDKEVHSRMATASLVNYNRMRQFLCLRGEKESLEVTMKKLGVKFIITESATTENLTDIMGDTPDMKVAGDSSYSNTGQDGLLNMGNFLARPVLIYSRSIDVDVDTSVRLAVWDYFTSEPSVRAKLRNFAYLKGDLHVRVVVSGSPFHYGRLLVSYQPYANYNSNISKHLSSLATPGWRTLFLNYLSQSIGASTMDVKANKPLEVVCPFISPKPVFRLFNNTTTAIGAGVPFRDFEVAGDLFIYSINPVKAVSDTPSPVYMQVFAWMENVELGVSTATQIVIDTESGTDEQVSGPLEKFCSSAAVITQSAEQIPSISWYAKASTLFFKGLGGLAAHFGWSKPVIVSHTMRVKPEPFVNGALTIGDDTVKRIVLDPKQELTLDPRCVGIDHDDMALGALCAVPSYYTTITWSDASPVLGTPIHIAKVTPCLGSALVADKVHIQPTAMAFAAAPFYYWRGDITFRFEIICSAFHRGKLAVFYEPNLSQMSIITSQFDLNKQYVKLVDIQETSVFEVTVQWASYRPWLYTSDPKTVAGNQGVLSTVGVGSANGFIALTPFTELQSPDGSAVSINVYAYSKNMHFNQLSSRNMPLERYTPGVSMLRISPESGLLPGTYVPTEQVDMVLNPSSATKAGISDICFGEQPLSFRALLKRYVLNRTLSVAASASTAPGVLGGIFKVNPVNNMVYDTAPVYLDLYSYLKYAYLGWRGGVRYRLHCSGDFQQGASTQFQVSRSPPSSTTTAESATWTGTTLTTGARIDGTVTYVPNSFGGFEVEFPFYTNNLFFFSFGEEDTPGSSDEIMSSSYTRNFTVKQEGMGPFQASSWNVEMATGEDFSFLRFSGAPFYSADL